MIIKLKQMKIKHLLVLLIILSASFNVLFCQTKAVTEKGDEVILYNNGTWSYSNDNQSGLEIIKNNNNKFIKNTNSTFLLKSKNLNIGIWLNPKVWTFKKEDSNESAEYLFTKKVMICMQCLSQKKFKYL